MANPADVAQRFLKAYNDRDVEAINEVMSPDCEVTYRGVRLSAGGNT